VGAAPAGGRRAAVFLDRDGVLNEVVVDGDVVRGPTAASDLVVVPGAAGELARLAAAGYLLVVVTNQPDVARGRTTLESVESVHAALRRVVAVDEVLVCPHDAVDGCACRKPLPGMLLDAAARHDVDLGASWLVGDRWVDIAAGEAAGVRTLLLRRPWSWEATSAGHPPAGLTPTYAADTLRGCIDRVLDPNPRPDLGGAA
jgi:D-glycero-D-manno-heptose 1,7-bisphosphate phosphatase